MVGARGAAHTDLNGMLQELTDGALADFQILISLRAVLMVPMENIPLMPNMDMPLKRKYRERPVTHAQKKGSNAGKSIKGPRLRPRRRTYGPWLLGESLHERCS